VKLVSGYHGKIYAGWKLPSGPLGVRSNMVALINKEMEGILAIVQKKRKSDSEPIGSGPGESGIESLQWGEDMGPFHLLFMFR
jgi:hypothetical protein